jgi:hypothetical protein
MGGAGPDPSTGLSLSPCLPANAERAGAHRRRSFGDSALARRLCLACSKASTNRSGTLASAGFGAATWTAANSFNLGRNSGITITVPAAAGSGGGYVIGS